MAPSDRHGWIDPIDTVEAGETASVWLSGREYECVSVPARLGGPPVSCVSPSAYVSTSVSCPAVRLWFEAC